MLTNGNVQQVVKHSMAYGFVLSQPFAYYVDAYPIIQNEVLTEAKTLYYGQHNEAVRVLQHKLNQLSYYDKEADGEFGVLTEYALKKFQKDNNLSTTGRGDMQTIDTLVRIERQKYMEPLKSISTTYHPGDTGEDIKTIQNALYYFGYYSDKIDGIYGPNTDKALKAFHLDHGIEVKEQVSEKTINAIYEAEAPEEPEESESPEVTEETPESTEQQEENSGETETPAPENNAPKQVKKDDTKQSIDTSALISTAKQYIGTPYVWGGAAPGGFDCSGLIQYVFEQLGYNMPRTVTDFWNQTAPVEKLSVGDLVFFETYKAGPSHMGIYIGNGQFINANSGHGVRVDDMNIDYWKQRYLGAKRVVIQN
ncbi:NlpC/P60 family protein [Radiobacillus sp. PE A8.2]|uniref:C40 family peptidase n=1 Tax=Radiobacillus sp. PE A8.2 TaxID=3380349 RepID=UPI00388E9D14